MGILDSLAKKVLNRLKDTAVQSVSNAVDSIKDKAASTVVDIAEQKVDQVKDKAAEAE